MTRGVVGLVLVLALVGCAASGTPPNYSAAPIDPNLLTVSRQNAADRWAADVARRTYVSQYMNLLCAPDGPWSSINAAWIAEEKAVWTDVLWKFEPIPGATRGSTIDFGSILNTVLSAAVKLAPLALATPTPRATLPPGVPPC